MANRRSFRGGKAETLTLGELAEKRELSPYNASRHVRILLEAGILSITRYGRFKRITIAEEFRQQLES